MKVRWTSVANRHREDIWLYIARDNPDAAADLDDRFAEAVLNLSRFPELGKQSKVIGMRELFPHKNYRLVYAVTADEILITALVHVARRWPSTDEAEHP